MGQLQGTDADHPASGEVTLDGGVLRLRGVAITQAPDAQVWLTRGFDKASGLGLGALASFSGDQDYPLAPGQDPAGYDSVVIWCDAFSVAIAQGSL